MFFQANLRVVQQIARWVVLALFIFLFLAYLNSAAFSAWVSGGLPNSYSLGWSRRALGYCSFALAALIVGVALFVGICQVPRVKKSIFVLLAIGLGLGVAPYVARFILEDKCLDSGLSWSKDALQCSNE